VSLIPVYTAVSVVSVLFAGWAIDRLGSTAIMCLALVPMAAGFLIIGYGREIGAVAVAFFIMGWGHGAFAALSGAFWPEHFGTKHLGSIRALATSVMVFGSALGPGVTGWLIDRGVNFPQQMIWIGLGILGVQAMTAAAVLRVRPRLRALAPPT
jgi:MFS family permease